MANTKTLYLAKDDSGIFLFTTRPVFEKDGPSEETEAGIWSESGDGKLILQLTDAECRDMFGFIPDLNSLWDVSIVGTLIEGIASA